MSGIFLRHLPSIYQSNERLARFLEPFEAILLGDGGLKGCIARLPESFDPDRALEEFLPWLADWLALSLRRDLPLDRQRALIARAVPLYAWRGTAKAIKSLLDLVTGGNASIVEPHIVGLRVGVESVVGRTTRLGRELPHYFQVMIDFPPGLKEHRSWLESVARETVDLAKPAHTYYELRLRFSE